jgi:hypothetical protein
LHRSIAGLGFRHTIDSYPAFYGNDRTTPTGLAGYLRERGFARVFLAGLAFDFCVRYSAEDAALHGLEAVVIEDTCRGIDLAGSMAATRASFAERGVKLRGGGWGGVSMTSIRVPYEPVPLRAAHHRVILATRTGAMIYYCHAHLFRGPLRMPPL